MEGEQMKEYADGTILPVPRDVVEIIQGFITMREKYMAEAFHYIAERFGLGARDIGEDQKWKLLLDREQWTCMLADKELSIDGAPAVHYGETKTLSIDEVLLPIVKLEIQSKLNAFLVHVVNLSFQDITHYEWALNPTKMTILISGKKASASEKQRLGEGLEVIGGMQ
jgi:hypothetical protein